jgi:uncharacterized delta-60 repeat protein
VLSLLCCAQALTLWAQPPGSLDPGFDPGSGANSTVIGVHEQADGKVVLVGNFTLFNNQAVGRIVRLNADGSIDNSYASGGGFDGACLALRAQADGKLLVIGQFAAYDGNSLGARVIRLNTDGTLDTGFTPPGFGSNAISALDLLPDGRILLGMSAPWQHRVVRLMPDGSVDPTFSTLNAINGSVQRLSACSDGRVLIFGLFTSVQGQARPGLAVLLSDGSLDTAFDPGSGPSAPPGPSPVQSMVALPSGHALIGGALTSYDGNAVPSIARLLPNGALDPSFNPGTGFNGAVFGLVPAAGDRLWCLGDFTQFNGSAAPYLCRLNSDGSRDMGYDPPAGPNGFVSVARASSSGRLYIGGFFTSYASTPRNRIARVHDCIATAWFADVDEDGFGDADSTVMACEAPAGFVADDTDCDDSDALVGAPVLWYADADDDGFGDPGSSQLDCSQPIGFIANDDDCDDTDDAIGAPQTYYIDLDDDGWGDASVTTEACDQPSGFTDNAQDCDDSDPEVADATMYFPDLDDDGFGDPAGMVMSCAPIAGYVDDDSDCDDTDPDIGAPSMWSPDADGDGHGASTGIVGPLCTAPVGFAPPGDCDDAAPLIYPGAACNDGDPLSGNDHIATNGTCTCVGEQVKIPIRMALQGPFDDGTGLMRDDLRALGLVPTLEPYTALGYAPAAGSVAQGSTVPAVLLEATGENAVVDWVIAELRSASDAAQEVTTRYLLLQADGDVIDLDGHDPKFPKPIGSYHIAVLHRNHMGVVTSAPRAIGISAPANAIDFTQASVAVHAGTDARATVAGIRALRMGDVTFNDDVMYTGAGNDRDPILLLIGGAVPTNSVSGYHAQDTNMDGQVRYVGNGNDRDPILLTVGGTTPTNVRANVYLRTSP